MAYTTDELENAAEKFATIPRNINVNEQGVYQSGLRAGFKAGAEWAALQPKEAIEEQDYLEEGRKFKAIMNEQSAQPKQEAIGKELFEWVKASEETLIDEPTCIRYDGGGLWYYTTACTMEELKYYVSTHNKLTEIEFLKPVTIEQKGKNNLWIVLRNLLNYIDVNNSSIKESSAFKDADELLTRTGAIYEQKGNIINNSEAVE